MAGLGASPTRFLVNTHFHFDHAGGNENFGNSGATIVAHENVRKCLADGSTVMGNVSPPAPAAALPVVTYDKGLTFHLNGDDLDVFFLGGERNPSVHFAITENKKANALQKKILKKWLKD